MTTTATIECDICGKECKGVLGLSIHMSRAHNGARPALGDIEMAVQNGDERAVKKAKRIQRELLAEGKQENVSGLISLMFPDGIPAHKISPLMDWIDSTRELMK